MIDEDRPPELGGNGESDPDDQLAADAAPEAPQWVPAEALAAVQAERDRYLRALAEADTRARRATDQAAAQVARANEDLLISLVPLLSGLGRALEAAGQAGSVEQMRTGLELIDRQVTSFLQSVGAELIQPQPGDRFNPDEHEAVFSQPATEQLPAGQIIGAVEPGVRLHGRVAQPARVAVAAADDASD